MRTEHTVALPTGVKSHDPKDRGAVFRVVAFGRRPTLADQLKIEANSQSALEVQEVLLYARVAVTRFGAVRLTPATEVTYPPWESTDVRRLLPGQEQWLAYLDVVTARGGVHDDVTHRLLGHPDPVQGDMQVECQLVSNGLYCGDRSGYEDPRAAGLLPGATQWRLLLQVDSAEGCGMTWGDAGRLYYWIRDDALARRDWASTWLILQSG